MRALSSQPCRLLRLRTIARRTRDNPSHRFFTTLAIETSCDDTAVAVLTRTSPSHASLLYNDRIASDNRAFKGVHPGTAVIGHATALAKLVQRAIDHLPKPSEEHAASLRKRLCYAQDGTPRLAPDFVSVTRGPGMSKNLGIGIDTAKGLSLAWGVPLVGVHHMQAHALTPQLVTALNSSTSSATTHDVTTTTQTSSPAPHFSFLSLLVSGGHTQLVLSSDLTTHRILATTIDNAIGNLLDQTARLILPSDLITSAPDVMYGRLLESFAFPPEDTDPYAFFTPCASRAEEMVAVPTGYDWSISLPFRESKEVAFSFSGIYSTVERITSTNPDMSIPERRTLARHTLSSAFRHLVGRICLAIEADPATLLPALRSALVVAGGVASNRFLMHVLRKTLAVRVPQLGGELNVVSPPIELCTDNAAMIAWTGMRMFEEGWYTDLSVLPIAKWPMDPTHGPGLLGVDGWLRREGFETIA